MSATTQTARKIAAQLAVLLTLSVAVLAMAPSDASAHDGPRRHTHSQTRVRVVRPALPRIVLPPARALLPRIVVAPAPYDHHNHHHARRHDHGQRRVVTHTTTRHGRRVTTTTTSRRVR